MKKITMVLAMMILIVMPGYAGWVNPEMARRAAQTFLSNNRAESSELSDVTSEAGFQNLYVFTTGNSFLVMSADDRVQPILGYSLTGGFVTENIPVNVSEWLQGYSDQIQFVKDNYPETTSEVTRQWQDLVSGTLALESSRTVVGPLITTAWDQTYPYNYYCPSASGGSGNHVYTGCGATAMAQVIKYHNAPVHGVGSHSYTHSTYGVQTANFNETTYQWNNMPTRIYSYSSQTQIDAVATLMYHCGVSIDMNYGISGSGASSSQIAPALRDYFNFSQSTTHIQRENYTDSDWIAQMRSELNASRPVIYNGYYTSGHSFVCDGYDSGSYNSDYFHFNWGWSGSYDGYFSIDDMTPGGNGAGGGGHNYSYYQDAIIGIQPSTNTAIPTNLTYTLNGRNVTLNWTSAGGNVSYNIYCNNMLVGNTTTTTYTEAAPFGTSIYYVRSVNSSGEQSLSSNSITVSVAYPTPVVDDLQATVTGNNVRLSWTAPDWCYPQTPTATLNYGEGSVNYSWTSVYYAHRYLAADLAQYANKAVYKVDTYIQCAGTYTVYVYTNSSSNNPAPNSLAATKSVTCNGAVGWLEINLPQPVIISGTTDLWVVMKQENTSETYPTPSFNLDSYNANACYQGSSSPTSLYCNSNYNISWFINTCITDGVYTYNIYRNGSNIASNVSTTYYNNNNLSTGGYTYYVKTNYYAGESEASNSVNVVIGNVTYYNITASAQPSNGGRVSGGGSYAQGTTCTLTATANEGYIFTNWTKNGQQVSTNPTYSFTVTGNASYIANFTEAPTGPQVVAEYYPDAENPNSPYVKVYWYEAKAASSSYYHIYRASCDGNDSILIASNVTGNEYIDQDWSYLAEGNYKYGVCFVDGRGESEIHWNNTPAPLSHHTIDASAFSVPVSNNGNADEPSQVNSNRGWLYYDDGTHATNVGASGTLYWGSMFPASMLTGNSLTKVALYESSNNTGTITLYVYSGGDTAPGTLVYTQDITPVAGNAFHEITLTSPVTINSSQNLWITFYQNGDSYPACACNDTGDANNRWVSVNGSTWVDMANAGVSGYGWMIRAYVDSNGGGGGGSDGPTVWSDCLVKSSRAVVGEGGETTNSYLPSYSYYNYTLSQQIYTSDEIGGAGTITNVSFFNGGSEKTRIYDVYMVHTDKSSFANNTDWIAVTESDRVFSSSVTMSANGWTVLQFDTPFVYNGTSNIALIVDDNSGNYTSSPHMACRVFNANGNQAIRIYSDGTNYDPYSPSGYSGTLHSVKNQIILGFLDTDSQIIPLSSGWNWFSPNVEITLEDLQNALVEALPGTTNIKITSQSNGTTTYNGTRWRGQLSSLDLAQMYMIEVTADCEMTLSGALINPVEHSVTIHNGSNWIAFPLSGSMSLTDAFAGFVINGDKVTSQSNGSATYNNRWRGQLTTLEDGKGYVYESAATGDRTFTFPISAK